MNNTDYKYIKSKLYNLDLQGLVTLRQDINLLIKEQIKQMNVIIDQTQKNVEEVKENGN